MNNYVHEVLHYTVIEGLRTRVG